MTFIAADPVDFCPRCSAPLDRDDLACPRCGLFTHLAEIRHLAAQAQAMEALSPLQAALAWERVFELLPPDAPQSRQVADRIRWLRGEPPMVDELFAGDDGGAILPGRQPQSDPLPLAVLKTGGSLLLNIPFYAMLFYSQMGPAATVSTALGMGLGFLLLILVHEMGHVLAMRHYGLSASPPIFIPFVGALINLRQQPKNAKVEAIVGIGGPLLGTAGAVAVYLLYAWTGWQVMAWLAALGFVINLFNMIPLPPLDGGRITAAVSPWIWVVGLVLLVGLIVTSGFPFLLILILLFALPRVIGTLRGRNRRDPYYRISRLSSWLIGIAYLGLTLTLIGFMYLVNLQLRLV